MNLIEAAKSGKSFKRPNWTLWINWNQNVSEGVLGLSEEDILADDYVLEEPQPKLITWYRPSLVWNADTKKYEQSGFWFKTKEETQNLIASHEQHFMVIEWEARELPEEWKE